jgi:hypothetical protein
MIVGFPRPEVSAEFPFLAETGVKPRDELLVDTLGAGLCFTADFTLFRAFAGFTGGGCAAAIPEFPRIPAASAAQAIDR